MTALSILPDAPQETDAAFLRRLLAANDATQALQIAVDHVVEASAAPCPGRD